MGVIHGFWTFDFKAAHRRIADRVMRDGRVDKGAFLAYAREVASSPEHANYLDFLRFDPDDLTSDVYDGYLYAICLAPSLASIDSIEAPVLLARFLIERRSWTPTEANRVILGDSLETLPVHDSLMNSVRATPVREYGGWLSCEAADRIRLRIDSELEGALQLSPSDTKWLKHELATSADEGGRRLLGSMASASLALGSLSPSLDSTVIRCGFDY